MTARRLRLALALVMTAGCSANTRVDATRVDGTPSVTDAGSPLDSGNAAAADVARPDAIWRGNDDSLADDSLITIHSVADIASRRRELVSYLWGSQAFPAGALPSAVHSAVSPVAGLGNLAHVDELEFSMPAKLVTGAPTQVTTTGYHFQPLSWKKTRAVILHQGHLCGDDDNESPEDAPAGIWRTIDALLSEGYPVVALFMPYMDPASCGQETHQWMFDNIDSSTSSPMKYFLEPTARTLNYLQANYPQYTEFAMIGLSGGGWTTTVYSAIDPRITLSIEVAGSLPLYVRSGASVGDQEQYWKSFYTLAGYPDLYLMSASDPNGKRRHVQVLNRRDSCCFGEGEYSTDGLPRLQGRTWDQTIRDYESNVRSAVKAVGGSFRLEVDEFANVHEITWGTLIGTILAELDGDFREVGAVSATDAFVRGHTGAIWHYGQAQGWAGPGAPIAGVPAGVTGAIHAFDVFYRDPATDRLALAGSLVSSFPIATDPVVASWGPGRVDIIALDSAYGITHWWSTGGACQSEALGGQGRGRPAIVATPGHLDVLVRNVMGGVDHYESDGSAPWTSESLGGPIVGFPAAVSAGGALRAYARGVDGAIYRASKDDDAWAWTRLQASDSFLGSPSATAVGSTEHVAARTQAGTLGSFTNGQYSNAGGSFVGSPTVIGRTTWVTQPSGAISTYDSETTWASVGDESE